MDSTNQSAGSQRVPVEDGEWRGWYYSTGDAFNAHAGPFYYRLQEDGTPVCAMRVEARHLNGGGVLHGGAIMTFADYSLYVFAAALGEARMVTVSFSGEFVGAVQEGAVVECTGEVIRSTGSMIFLRGLMKTDGAPVFNFSGVLKKLRPRA